MKHNLVFLACCLLLLGSLNAAAQEYTSPLPPPESGTSTIPGPDQVNSAGAGTSGPAEQQPAARSPARSAPDQPAADQPEADSSQDGDGIPGKGLFWGFKIGGSYDWYSMKRGLMVDGHGEEAKGGGFNAGLLFGYDFGLLAGQAEILINTGWNGYNASGYSGSYYGEEHLGFNMTALQIPVMLKLDLHGNRIMFQPQVGFYLNFGLGDMTYNYDAWTYGWPGVYGEGSTDYSSPLFGFMAGGAFGVRIGRGYLFLDVRYAGDLGNTEAMGIEVKRHSVMTGLGYQYYFRSSQ